MTSRAYLRMIREKAERSKFQELMERTRYMERILKRTIEGISLDTKSLGKLADALDADEDTTTAAASDPQHLEGLEIDDEACTMEPVGDSTTRSFDKLTFSFLRYMLNDYRLLRGILLLEFFYANQKSHRKPH